LLQQVLNDVPEPCRIQCLPPKCYSQVARRWYDRLGISRSQRSRTILQLHHLPRVLECLALAICCSMRRTDGFRCLSAVTLQIMPSRKIAPSLTNPSGDQTHPVPLAPSFRTARLRCRSNFLLTEASFPQRTGCCSSVRSMSQALIRFSFQSSEAINEITMDGGRCNERPAGAATPGSS